MQVYIFFVKNLSYFCKRYITNTIIINNYFMKFIPKKQTGGLINRYLQSNKYNINTPIAQPAPTMITPNPPYFSPEETKAQLARQAVLQAEYDRSVTPVDIAGVTAVGQDRSFNYKPTMPQPQAQLVPRAQTMVPGPIATPGSVSGIQDLIETWKTGNTSQTAAAEPAWRMPIKGQVASGTVDKMKAERETAEKAKPVAKPVAKPTTKPVVKPAAKTATPKGDLPKDTKMVGVGKNEKAVQKAEYINTGSKSKKPIAKPAGKTVDGGFVGHVLNQMAPGKTNKSSFRYNPAVEAIGMAAAGDPTLGAVVGKALPNVPKSPMGEILHWLSPGTTNVPKR